MRKHYKKLLPVYLQGLVGGKYTLREASESTGYSITYLSILKKRYINEGINCLEHHNKYRIPAIKKPQKLRELIAGIYASKYKDVNFAFYRRCLAEFENINVSYNTLRTILREYGQISPEAHRAPKAKPARRTRLRRRNFGDLLQIDGTPFPWFYKSGDTRNYCLVGAIDDATSMITGLYITEYECLYGYMEMLRQTIDRHGVPREIYSDRAAIFCYTPRKKQNLTEWEQLEGVHDKKTQWQRILDELSIRQVLAWSPEAKGRVERMWKTIQGELPQLFYLNKITSIHQANAWLSNVYIDRFNAQFGKTPYSPDSFFLPCTQKLDDILCCRIARKTDGAGCIHFHSYLFQVQGCWRVRSRPVTLCISERGMFAQFQNDSNYYPLKCLNADLVEDVSVPQVVENIIYRYMFAYAKEVSV